jgi:hypothetical protein
MDDKKTITITIEEYNLLLENQKQVDELKNRFENKACCNMSENCSMVQQAVKDTAKEILQMLYTAMPKTNIVVEIKKRYGVEVE